MTNISSQKVRKALVKREKQEAEANDNHLDGKAMSNIVSNYHSQRSIGRSNMANKWINKTKGISRYSRRKNIFTFILDYEASDYY